MQIKLYNTLSGKKETFSSIKEGVVKMYNCGPTVYGVQHLGNLSMFVFTDILRRTLEYAGYKVDQVINITDFGHLSGDNLGDSDIGEDKMSKGIKNEGLGLTLENMKIVAKKYANIFFQHLKVLDVDVEEISFPFASDYIPKQIEIIKKLEEDGFAYRGEEGVYFDTSKFKDYGELGNIDIKNLKEGARVSKKEKRNPSDFLLWKHDKNIGWQSDWGLGFPGWHIECSAMIIALLGDQIDIHTGGIEHIGVHHNNEIAQSESYTGKKPFSKFWLHREHIKVEGEKIAKSSGTAIYIDDLIIHKIHPLSFRYWLLTSHYQTPTNLTWEILLGSQTAFEKIVNSYKSLEEDSEDDNALLKEFEEAIGDNLNTPIALSLLQKVKSKKAIDQMDRILGLGIKNLSEKIYGEIPEEILELQKERDLARESKDWAKSDSLRKDIEKEGFVLEDLGEKSSIRRPLSTLV